MLLDAEGLLDAKGKGSRLLKWQRQVELFHIFVHLDRKRINRKRIGRYLSRNKQKGKERENINHDQLSPFGGLLKNQKEESYGNIIESGLILFMGIP